MCIYVGFDTIRYYAMRYNMNIETKKRHPINSKSKFYNLTMDTTTNKTKGN